MKGFLLLSGLLATTASAHMQMKQPYPIRSPLNKNATGKIDYSYTNSLSPSGSDYPCKGYQNDPFVSEANYTPGQSYEMELAGEATHGGGSCQLALTYDKGKTFKVIESMLGECPIPKKYKFTVPSDAPSGEALLAWTWFNKIGNREMYMNCAMVTIGGDSSRMMDNSVDMEKREGIDMPSMIPEEKEPEADGDDDHSSTTQVSSTKENTKTTDNTSTTTTTTTTSSKEKPTGKPTSEKGTDKPKPTKEPQDKPTETSTSKSTSKKATDKPTETPTTTEKPTSTKQPEDKPTETPTSKSTSKKATDKPTETSTTTEKPTSTKDKPTKTPTETSSSKQATAFKDLPPLFVANVNQTGQCVTIEDQTVDFPEPGDNVMGKSDGKGFKCSGNAPFLGADASSSSGDDSGNGKDSTSKDKDEASKGKDDSKDNDSSSKDSSSKDSSSKDKDDDSKSKDASKDNDSSSKDSSSKDSSSKDSSSKDSSSKDGSSKADSSKTKNDTRFAPRLSMTKVAKVAKTRSTAKSDPRMMGIDTTNSKEFREYVGNWYCYDGEFICSPDGLSWAQCANGYPVYMGPVARGTLCREGRMVDAGDWN